MVRLLGYFFGIGVVMALLVAAGIALYIGDISKDLPDYEVLAKYEPPVTTRVHASDGALMAEFARERRLYLPIQAVPDRVKAAFLSAEDKNFYSHPGIDVTGLARAVLVNIQNMGSGRRPVGASTITQQVAKNFLLTRDQTYERKVREIAASPLVTWIFTDANFGDVLLLKGRAHIHHDFGEIQLAWDRLAGAAQRYAVGPLADANDNRLVTIDTRVARFEMTSPALGIPTAREVVI